MTGATKIRSAGIGRLVLRHLRNGSGASLIVSVVVALTAFAVSMAPRALDLVGTEQLRYELGAQPPGSLDIVGTGNLGLSLDPGESDPERVLGPANREIERIGRELTEPLASAVGDPIWYSRTDYSNPTYRAEADARLSVALAVELHWTDRVRIVEGRLPTGWTGDTNAPFEDRPPIEIAISADAAEVAHLALGDLVDLQSADAVVTAIYEPIDPDASFWIHATELAAAVVQLEPGAVPTIRVGALVAPETVGPLGYEFSGGRMLAWLPVDPAAVPYLGVSELQTQVRNLEAARATLPYGGGLLFRSGLTESIDRVVATVAATSALLSLCASGLLGVLVTVLTLGVGSVLRRRRPALALLAARGASSLQIRGLATIEGVLLALPAAAVGGVAGALVLPGLGGAAAWVSPLLVGLIPVVLFAVLASPGSLQNTRADLGVRGRGRARAVAEIGVIVLAAVSLLLLARRGLVAATAAVGTDPLLAATPVLLAVAVGIVALRVYPAPLAALHRMLRRSGGPSSLVGLARAIRDPALGFTASLALVVGVSVVILTVVMGSTVRAGLERAAAESVGADLQVTGGEIAPEVLAAIEDVDGVAFVAAVSSTAGVPFESADGAESEVTVVATDTAALHAVAPDIPDLSATGGLPQLFASDNWGDRVVGDEVQVGDGAATVVGVASADLLPGISGRWLLIDSAAADALGLPSSIPRLALVGFVPGRDAAGVGAAVDAAVVATDASHLLVVRDQADALAEARSPAVLALELLLLLVAGASLALTVLAVVLASAAAAGRRNRLLGIVGVLGGARRTTRGLMAWELGPVAVTALIVGTGLGLVLPLIVTGVLDLRVFVGGRDVPGVVIDPLSVAIGVGAFIATVVVAGTVAILLGRRLSPARTLKMGDA